MQLTKLETLLSLDRSANIIRYSEMVKDLQGDIAEFGCFRCGSFELLAKLNPHKNCIAIDSFEGLPKPNEYDTYHKEKDFNEVEYEAVYGYFKTLYPNVELLKGFSPDVFLSIPEFREFSLVHIDVDLYSSTYHGLDFFYPRLVKGGVIILDDFGFKSTEGSKKATLDFAETIEPEFKGELFYYPEHSHKQYLIVK